MRIDVKTVKDRHYLQYLDKYGCLHHLGSAGDFFNWLLSLIIWNKEYLDERKELFESTKAKARQYIELNEEKEQIIDNLYDHYVPSWREAKKKRIHVPERIFVVWTEADESLSHRQARLIEQPRRLWDTQEWRTQWNALEELRQKLARESEKRRQEWSSRLQKRLDAIYFKQRRGKR